MTIKKRYTVTKQRQTLLRSILACLLNVKVLKYNSFLFLRSPLKSNTQSYVDIITILAILRELISNYSLPYMLFYEISVRCYHTYNLTSAHFNLFVEIAILIRKYQGVNSDL